MSDPKPDWMKPGPNLKPALKIKSLIRELYAARGEDPLTARICEAIEKELLPLTMDD